MASPSVSLPPASLPPAIATTATSTPSSNSNPFASSSSSSLYLYTFVITLVVLVLISSCVVTRTCILRRRFNRRIQEAIAAGVLHPDQVDAFRNGWRGARTGADGEVGERPKIWEVTLGGAGNKVVEEVDVESGMGKDGGAAWADIMPVSASIITPPSHLTSLSLRNKQTAPEPARRHHFNPFARARDQLPSSLPTSFPMSASPPSTSNSSAPPILDSQLQVTVLIALPTPHSNHTESDVGEVGSTSASGSGGAGGDKEEELPEVMFGVAEVPWSTGERWDLGSEAEVGAGTNELKEKKSTSIDEGRSRTRPSTSTSTSYVRPSTSSTIAL